MASIWSGAIEFGLVGIPVKLTPSSKSHNISFHQLHNADNGRIRLKRVCQSCNTEVPFEDITKGYEYAKDAYVELSPEEIGTIAPEKSSHIVLSGFLNRSDVPIVAMQESYYAAPDGSDKAYRLFADTLVSENKVALGELVLRSRAHPVMVSVYGGRLVVTLLDYADETIDPATIEVADVSLSDKESDLARTVIESLSDPEFSIAAFVDSYTEELNAMIEAKIQGTPVSARQPGAVAPKIDDLMQALEASIKKTKGAS